MVSLLFFTMEIQVENVFDPKTRKVTRTLLDQPAKLKNKFKGARAMTIDQLHEIFPTNTYVTPNPMFASFYALRNQMYGTDNVVRSRGSVIPIYIIADKVTNLKRLNFMELDKAGTKAKKGEVIIGDDGRDYNFGNQLEDMIGVDQKQLDVIDKKYGTDQYVFQDGVQVFSAITGERLTNLPFIKQNIKNRLLNLSKKEEDIMLKNLSPEDRLKYKSIKTGGDGTQEMNSLLTDYFIGLEIWT